MKRFETIGQRVKRILGSRQAQVDMQKAFKIIGKGGKVVWIKTSAG